MLPESKTPWVWDNDVLKKYNIVLAAVHDHFPGFFKSNKLLSYFII